MSLPPPCDTAVFDDIRGQLPSLPSSTCCSKLYSLIPLWYILIFPVYPHLPAAPSYTRWSISGMFSVSRSTLIYLLLQGLLIRYSWYILSFRVYTRLSACLRSIYSSISDISAVSELTLIYLLYRDLDIYYVWCILGFRVYPHLPSCLRSIYSSVSDILSVSEFILSTWGRILERFTGNLNLR